MRLHHLVHYFQTNVWAIEPAFFAAGQRLLREAIAGRRLLGADLHAALGVPMPEERPPRQEGNIGVIPITGVIEDHASSLGTSARELDSMFTAALQSKKVDAILFDVDLPGGVVTGIPELAEKIQASQGIKPMLAYNSGMMASAAYWLGASAGEVMTLGSGQVGSIGVFTFHIDESRALENEGIKVTEVSAGTFKTEGAPWKPLTEDAEADLQTQVDDAYTAFVRSVSVARKDTQQNVRAGYGQGRVVTGEKAVKANLVDRVGTFEEAVNRLVDQIDKPMGKRADRNRRRMALDGLARGA